MRHPVCCAAALLLASVLGGCAASSSAPTATASTAAASTAGTAGTTGSTVSADASSSAAAPSMAVSAAPGATVAPSDVTGSADLAGLSIMVLAPTSTDPATAAEIDTVVAVLRDAASAGGAELTVATDDLAAATDGALASGADVIVGVGPDTVSTLDLVAAANLDRSFLVLGAQLAEPTENVVAVVWPGADARVEYADEEPGFAGASTYAAEAVARGFAALQADADGYVVSLG
ncbi:MAG TPA: hypothetical protein VGC67_08820 [Cellulomonas sp.]